MTTATEIAFNPAVIAAQERKGSRKGVGKLQMQETISPDLQAFIESRDSAYLGTASADGQPYIQHRGGPQGFLKVLDARTIGLVDFKGNRQFISTGNLDENPKAFLFLMDYTNRQRIKIWGRARIVENDPDLVAKLMPEGYRARPEQVILFEVTAWDANCPQHIPVMYPEAQVADAIAKQQARIEALEAELARLRGDVPAPLEV